MYCEKFVSALNPRCLDGLVSALSELRPLLQPHADTIPDEDLLRLGCVGLLTLKYSKPGATLDPSILRSAAWHDHPETVRFILQAARKDNIGGRGAILHGWLLSSAMRIACLNGNVEVVRVLLAAGCPLEEASLHDILLVGDKEALAFASEESRRESRAWMGALFRCIECNDDERAMQLYMCNPAVFALGAIAVAIVWFGDDRKLKDLARVARKAVLTEKELRLIGGYPGFSLLSAHIGGTRQWPTCPTATVALYALREFGVAPASTSCIDVLEELQAADDLIGMDYVHNNWPDDV